MMRTVVVLLLAFLPTVAWAETRVALVIGNSAYDKVGLLPNPARDAADVADVLAAKGFDVTRAANLGIRPMRDALRAFRAKAANADVALVYYAGHGMEIGGVNYLLPIDAALAHSDDVQYEAVPLGQVRDAMTGVRRLRVVILDACRDNPYMRTMTLSGRDAPSRGLAAVRDAAAAEIIAFAAAEGSTALDGVGGNSPFTAALVKRLQDPSIDVRFLFGGVSDDVRTATGRDGKAPQSPAIYAPNLGGNLVALVPPDTVPTPAKNEPALPPDAAVRAEFETAKLLKSLGVWDAFLKKYPSSVYAIAAREERDRLAAPPKEGPSTEAKGLARPETEAYRLSDGAVLNVQLRQTVALSSVAFSPDGRTVLSGGSDKLLRLWDISTGHTVQIFKGHSDQVQSVAFSSDGRTVLSGGYDKTLRLWDVSTGKILQSFGKHSNGIRSVAFIPASNAVISGDDDGILRLWNSITGKLVREFKAQSGGILSIAPSPDGRTVLSGLDSEKISLSDLTTGKIIRIFEGHTDVVNSVAFSPDGRFGVSASGDRTIILWDVATGKAIRTFNGHLWKARAVAFASDGQTVLSAGDDKSLRLWDVATGKTLRTFGGQLETINAVAFSPDGRLAISAGDDGLLSLWDVSRGKLLASMVGDVTGSLAFTPDGPFTVTGDGESWMSIVKGNALLPMDDFLRANRRDSLASILGTSR